MRDWHGENRARFDEAEIVQLYAGRSALQPAEEHLFHRYVPADKRVLDVGVGAGRTTPALASDAAFYLGVDYAAAMIDVCRTKFPGLDFAVADAADMPGVGSESFDVVVFSFNGLDYVFPAHTRSAAVLECRRALVPNGLFIFSSHNPRAMLPRPFLGASGSNGYRLKRAVGLTTGALAGGVRRLPTRAFVRGAGYFHDSARGLRTYGATPRRVTGQLSSMGFDLVEVIGAYYPKPARSLLDPWYYYVFRRVD